MQRKDVIGMIIALLIIALISITVWATEPEGATPAAGTAETSTPAVEGSTVAQGGYIRELNLTTESQTHLWQGYWGEVNGNITLEDASGNKMYNWEWDNSDAGEVYASEASTPTWTTVVAGSTTNVKYVGGSGTSESAVDTFTSTSTWTIANKTVTSVPSTSTYNYTDAGTFNMGILSDGTNMIFVSTLYNNANDFKNGTSDFQLMVPVNETAVVTYYLWLELS
ncbi:hypothetical protein HZC30_03930 [Candidatus Woesearchaeota archaeon]|nr:hypothetical protein [Candidatus Woesearchaeota archaeon]